MIRCQFHKCSKRATHRLYDLQFYCDKHGFPPNERAVTLFLPRSDSNGVKILGVSRKNNKNDWGLPGGKVEPSDYDDYDAIIREVNEECGMIIYNLLPIFTYLGAHGKVITTYTALCNSSFIKSSPNEGLCKWIDPRLILKGTFSVFNQRLFNTIGWAIE